MNVCCRLKKEGVLLVLFSNTNELHIRHIERVCLDLLLLPNEIGAEKPTPPMYGTFYEM